MQGRAGAALARSIPHHKTARASKMVMDRAKRSTLRNFGLRRLGLGGFHPPCPLNWPLLRGGLRNLTTSPMIHV